MTDSWTHRPDEALALIGAATLAAAGCGGMHTLTSEVSSFGAWPADPTSIRIEKIGPPPKPWRFAGRPCPFVSATSEIS